MDFHELLSIKKHKLNQYFLIRIYPLQKNFTQRKIKAETALHKAHMSEELNSTLMVDNSKRMKRACGMP